MICPLRYLRTGFVTSGRTLWGDTVAPIRDEPDIKAKNIRDDGIE